MWQNSVYECEKDCGFKHADYAVVEGHESTCGQHQNTAQIVAAEVVAAEIVAAEAEVANSEKVAHASPFMPHCAHLFSPPCHRQIFQVVHVQVTLHSVCLVASPCGIPSVACDSRHIHQASKKTRMPPHLQRSKERRAEKAGLVNSTHETDKVGSMARDGRISGRAREVTKALAGEAGLGLCWGSQPACE